MGCCVSQPILGGHFASHEQLAQETHCERACFLLCLGMCAYMRPDDVLLCIFVCIDTNFCPMQSALMRSMPWKSSSKPSATACTRCRPSLAFTSLPALQLPGFRDGYLGR